MRRRLERQQRQHVVHIGAHGARAARPPGPHRGRDVVDDRNLRRRGAHLARHPMGEFGTVDDHQRRPGASRSRARPPCGSRRRIDRMRARIEAKPTTACSSIGNRLASPCSAIACPPTPSKRERLPGALAQRLHQRGAEPVARLFGRDQEDLRDVASLRVGGRGHAPAPAGVMPTTNTPRASASCATRCGSATIAAPATAARPARPARATASTVSGPMVGRSKRRSCCGFGALTSTPAPAGHADAALLPQRRRCGRASGRCPRSPRRRARDAPATTAACPMSNGPVAASSSSPRAMSARSPSVGRRLPSAPSAQQDLGRHLVGAEHAKALVLDHAGDAGQQVVVAAAKRARDARQPADRRQIEPEAEPEAAEGRARQRADEHEVAAAFLAQQAEEAAERAEHDPVAGVALDLADRQSRAARTSPRAGRAGSPRRRPRAAGCRRRR